MSEEIFHIAWQATYACNLSCVHCYAASDPRDLLTREEALKLIEEAHEVGAKSFVFTGGEPLTRPDILELIEFASSVGLKPIVATNATLITSRHLEVFKRCKASVAVNLPALSEETHAVFVGASSALSKKLKAIDLMVREGIAVSIGVAVTKLNICEVENVIQFAEEKNIFCDVMAVVPVGRATADIMPQPQQYRDLIARLLEKWRALPMNAIGCKAFSSWKTRVSVYEPSYVALLSSEGFEAPGKLCSITQTLHIMEDGSARPCPFIPYTVGNVRREALRSIWKKMKSDKFLQKLASGDGLKGRCRECPYRSVCVGCRARAYWIYRDYFAEDPVCIL